MKTEHIPGLGPVSLARVAQIELCDEAGGLDTFHLGTVVKSINERRINELPEKVIRQAAFTLVKRGVLANFSAGMYKWL